MRNQIVVLSRSLPMHGFGGMEIVAWDLAKEFARAGIPVTVITTRVMGSRGEFDQDGVHVVPLDEAPSRQYSAAWWRESRRYFERQHMDSVRAVLSVSSAGFGLLPLKPRVIDVPFIMQAHGTSWGEVVSKWSARRPRELFTSIRNLLWMPRDLLAYAQFDAVVAVGDRVYRDLTRAPGSWGLPAHKVHLIHNGIDTTLFHPSRDGCSRVREDLGLAEGTPVVISASRLHAQKGVGHALRAFALLRRTLPDAVYLIAGDGPERERLEALTRELGVAEQVRFLGAVQRVELADYLKAADAFLFLTEHVEGLPLNVLEALASGLAVVVSQHLNLFPSPNLRRVAPRDTSTAARLLGGILSGRPSERTAALPDQYVLRYVTERYLNLFGLSTYQGMAAEGFNSLEMM